MTKYLNFVLGGSILLLTICCSSYKQHIAGKSYEYKNTKIEKSLESNSKQFPLVKNNRYSIPSIPGKWTGPVDPALPLEEKNNDPNKN